MRERTFAWQDPQQLATAALDGRSGLEFLTAIQAGELPSPPVAELLGMELVELERERVVFALTPAEWMFNPIGSVHGGIAATILDSCMGCAIHTTLPAGVGYTTSDLQVRYLRAMNASTGRVLAEGRVVSAGRRLATAEGRLVVEQSGKLVATATTGALVLGGS